MSNQILISEQQQHMLASSKEENLIDENLSYKMMLMMSKMNESTANAANALNQYQSQPSELIITDHSITGQQKQSIVPGQRAFGIQDSSASSLNTSLTRNTLTPPTPQQQMAMLNHGNNNKQSHACATCPSFESHYWRLVIILKYLNFIPIIQLFDYQKRRFITTVV